MTDRAKRAAMKRIPVLLSELRDLNAAPSEKGAGTRVFRKQDAIRKVVKRILESRELYGRQSVETYEKIFGEAVFSELWTSGTVLRMGGQVRL